MSIIISGQNQAHFGCDHLAGCNEETENFYYEENVVEIDEKARKLGWYVSVTADISYCPKHSPYNQKI